ncbi:hypothetical protein [Streptomyces cinereoruber]|uniref:hypothetical protein n=2 Tax=Streptomyces cinereoruber TaxID=67260 RepID=UPI003C2C80B4
MGRAAPRKVAALAEERGLGELIGTDRCVPLAVWLAGGITASFWLLVPAVVLARLYQGAWDEYTAWLALGSLLIAALFTCGHRLGWHRGALYRFDRGVVLRRFRSIRAYTWAELTTRTHEYWTSEGDRFEYQVRHEELELRTLDSKTVFTYDRCPTEVRDLVLSAHEPQDALPTGTRNGPPEPESTPEPLCVRRRAH